MPDNTGGSQEIGLQFSVYPLRQEELQPAVDAAVRAAAREGLDVRVGRMSTFASGAEDQVFGAVRAAFEAARSVGPSVMVVTLTSSLVSESSVSETQSAAGG